VCQVDYAHFLYRKSYFIVFLLYYKYSKKFEITNKIKKERVKETKNKHFYICFFLFCIII